jgi:aminoglycoside phosphotransferase (APT) family kinase protein
MTGQPDHWLAMRQASAAVGLDAAGARLIHHYSNAIYLLPAQNVVTSGHLAVLLRLLHQAGTPPVSHPAWVPLASLHATVEDRLLSAALTDDERTWITDRITEVRDKIAGLDWPLGVGLIHGDAWAGNLLSCPGASPVGAVLGDWDWVSTGPREIDLIPTWHAAARYGRAPSWVSDFISQYDYDLARVSRIS